MALSDYYSIYDLSNKNKNEKNEDEYNSFFNYMIGKNEVTKINEKNLLKKEKELNFQNFIGDERDRKIPRKKEIENLFKNSERVSGIKSSINFLEDERSRYLATTKKQDHRITDPLRVNRGLGLAYNDNSQTGIHPMYRAEQKSVDDLRTKSNQKFQAVNPPITSGKKESKFLNSITKESLTRTPIKLLEKATQLIKGKSYIYAPTTKKNITIRKEEKSKEIIGNVNKKSSGIVIPGIFEPPKSTRKLTQDIGKSTFVNNSNNRYILNDKNSVQLKQSQSFTYKHQPFKNIQAQNNAFQSNFIQEPKFKQSNFYEEKSFKNFETNNKGFYNQTTEIPELTQKNTLSNHNNNNLVGNNLGYTNKTTEIPELTQKNTLSNYNNNNLVGNNLGYTNNTIQIPEMTMKEVNTKETHVKNILPVFKNFYNKVTEKPQTTERETYKEKEKGNIFKNNETYNKFLESPETTMREINSENKNVQQINDPTGLGYTSNIKEASTTMRQMYSENKKQNSNIKNSNKSFTINTTNLNPTQRQFDSVNSNNNGNIKFKNSHSKVFDKKGVCISEKRNLIESEVEKREPTKRNVNIIPSKNIIGNVELRPESRQLENLNNAKYNPTKNHTDFC